MPGTRGGILEEGAMKVLSGLLALASLLTAVAAHAQGQAQSQAQTYTVATRSAVPYVEHDGVKLAGEL